VNNLLYSVHVWPFEFSYEVIVSNEISEITRRAIIDAIAVSHESWSGRIGDGEFLARLYDLTKLPSHDHRYSNAAGDIHQHCVRNDDWAADWVFFDDRFNLLYATDDEFLRFLVETVHPIVRPNIENASALVASYNQELIKDGWNIVEIKRISDRPLFVGQRLGSVAVFAEPTGWPKVDRQLQEVRSRLDEADTEEKYQAVGLLCREALISVAQEIYDTERHPPTDEATPSDTDVKRLLDSIFAAELKGSPNEEARAHAKAAVKLALALQHKRTADFKMAALCAEATSSVINLLAVLSGRRGRSLS
jgi:hypothetical protein